MPKVLTQRMVDDYHHDGCLFPLPALSTTEAASYRQNLEDYEKEAGGKLTELGGAARFKNHLLFKWVNDLVRLPAILDAVEDVIGPNILCYTSTFFIKEENSRAIAAWHQDSTYFGVRPHEHVTAWLALTESTPDNGCLIFLPGTSSHGQMTHRENAVEHSVNGGRQKIIEEFDASSPLMAPLKAGEFSLHHTLCIHRSAPNKTNDRRIGIGISYVPTRVRHIGTHRMPAMLVRGTDEFGHFDLEPEPVNDLDEAARASHADVYKRYRANYNEQLTWHQEGKELPIA
jgi:non-heme Fe2+,alpha-ketoglutarate-dependent halogenase